MSIEKEHFEAFMERILDRLDSIDTKISDLSQKHNIVNGKNLLDNQDMCFLLKVNKRTLQRYRMSGNLPYIRIMGKNYYMVDQVHEFIRKHMK